MSKEDLDINTYINIIISDNKELKKYILSFINQNFQKDLFLNLINDDNIKDSIDTLANFCSITTQLIDECINILNNQLDSKTLEYAYKIKQKYRDEKINFNIVSTIKLLLIQDIKNKKLEKKEANIIGIKTYNHFLLLKYFKKKKTIVEDSAYLNDFINYNDFQFNLNLEDYYSYEDFEISEFENLNQDNIKNNYQKSTIFDVLEKEAQEEFERFINSDIDTNKKNIRLESPNSITHPFVF